MSTKLGKLAIFRREIRPNHNDNLSVVRPEVPVFVAISLRDEFTKMVRWNTDTNNRIEPTSRRLFTTLIDSGADELGPARNTIAQLLEFGVACDLR